MKPQSLEKRRKKDALLTDREKLQAGTHTTISHTQKRRKIITVTRTYFFFLECVTFRTSCSESSYSKWGRGGLNILFFSFFLSSFLSSSPPLHRYSILSSLVCQFEEKKNQHLRRRRRWWLDDSGVVLALDIFVIVPLLSSPAT